MAELPKPTVNRGFDMYRVLLKLPDAWYRLRKWDDGREDWAVSDGILTAGNIRVFSGMVPTTWEGLPLGIEEHMRVALVTARLNNEV